MLATNVATSYRKRHRRHDRIPVAVARDRHVTRLVALHLPATDQAPATPGAVWADPDMLHADLELATWEDAEWR